MIGRKHFNAAAATSFPEIKIDVWPGFTTAVGQYGQDHKMYIEIDTSYKVLRKETVLEFINQNNKSGTAKSKIEDMIVGFSVMTGYNKRMYKVERVDWEKNPTQQFNHADKRKKGVEPTEKTVTLIEYYKTRHN